MKKIIIIEDDVDTLDMMETILQDNGFAVITANRMVGINEIISINPDLAIIDIMLSYGFGNDLCLEIKSNPKSSHIPVILYSASHDLKKLSKDCRADTYLEKPFDLETMLKMVKEVVS